MASSPTSSASNQDTAVPQHQQESLIIQQQRQQELIKLIAQHFHQQFYQLASSTTSAPQIVNQTSNRQQSLAPYHHHHHLLPDNHRLYSSQEEPIQQASDLNLLAPNKLDASLPTKSSLCLNDTGPYSNGEASSLLDFSNSSNHHHYPVNNNLDFSLLGALGLNFTNNQLALSLQHQHQHQQQQQSILEAARQYNHYNNEQQSRLVRVRLPSEESNNLQEQQRRRRDSSGRDMLKFSISTILGSNSDQTPAALRVSSDSCLNSKTNLDLIETLSPKFNTSSNASSVSRLKSENIHQPPATNRRHPKSEVEMVECDLSTECPSIDSSTLKNSSPKSQNSTQALPLSRNRQQTPLVSPLNNEQFLFSNNNSNRTTTTTTTANEMPPFQQTTLAPHPTNLSHHHQALPNFLAAQSSAFPWTVAARGKPRRGMMRRAVFSDSQRVGLEKRFQLQKYISKPDRKKLAEKLSLRDSQVKIWFQNRRMKWRNSKERELLSAGGSREQTLPTRNNPNPDLSDVGETIKRLQINNNNSTQRESNTSS